MTMVSPPFGSRLLSVYPSSASSNSTSASNKHRRHQVNEQSDSMTGYSTDREDWDDPSVMPVQSLTSKRKSCSSDNGCTKRRTTIEQHFAASCVKEDLKLAGKAYIRIDKSKKTHTIGTVSINLKGVQLVHSNDPNSPISSSSTSTTKSSTFDYDHLMSACFDSYGYQAPGCSTASVNSLESTRSASSLSDDTEIDESYANDAGSAPTFLLPPLLEDSVVLKVDPQKVSTGIGTCYMISSSATALTLEDMLCLSKKARYVSFQRDW